MSSSGLIGIIVLTLVILSIIFPLILIPVFNLWATSGFILLIFGLAIIILSGFWFSNQKRQGLSVTLPIVGFVVGGLVILIGIILTAVRYLTVIPQTIQQTKKPAFTLDECLDTITEVTPDSFTYKECAKAYPETISKYLECKGLVDSSLRTGTNPPELARDILKNDTCQRECNRNRQIPLEDCYDKCRNSTNCLRFQGLGPFLHPSAPIVRS